MAVTPKNGMQGVGVIFIILAAVQMLKGDSWIVWLILGFLFGGFGYFSSKKPGGDL
ncbi:hypothetical protein [Aurantiacibacter marinus]|uniref:hypothetical protein n=1 Tax=Aurantiacibacter marinus TaxID=874156 RepID=UPI000A6BA2EB|nr:hypothetical protein [Aurantiacibacter marinus]